MEKEINKIEDLPKKQKEFYDNLFKNRFTDINQAFEAISKGFKRAFVELNENPWFMFLFVKNKETNEYSLSTAPFFNGTIQMEQLSFLTKTYLQFIEQDGEFREKFVLEGIIYGMEGTSLIVKRDNTSENLTMREVQEEIRKRGIDAKNLSEQKDSMSVLIFNYETKDKFKTSGFEFIKSDDGYIVVSEKPFMDTSSEDIGENKVHDSNMYFLYDGFKSKRV